MRTPPEDKYDREELERLNAESWMLEHLKLNPNYTCWGPGEDYMSTKGEGWSSSQVVNSWQEFGPWNLDDLNECVNFYFEIERDSEKCTACDGSGYSPKAKLYSDQWYGYQPFNPEGVKVECDACDGHGHIYTEPAAHLNLVVWILHPRKGCSRGVRIKNLSKQDAAAARAWLRKAAERNAERFAKVVNQ